MDRIDLFRIFVRVVECSSFTRASNAMNMPRSTISAAVAELESRVGVRLLHRTTRSVSLTSAGRSFYLRCLDVMPAVEEAENLFRQGDVPLSGNIKIDVPGRIGRLILSPALPAFFQNHPQITLDMGVSDRNVNLVEEGIDCALRVGELADSSLVARKIGFLRFINVAAPAYLARHGCPATPAELAAHQVVNYASPTTGRIDDWEWTEKGRTQSVKMRSQVTVNSAEAYISCCLAGLGIIQIPQYDVQSCLDAGELVEILPDYLPAAPPVTLLYSHRKHLSPVLRTFIDWAEPLLKQKCC